MTTERAYYDYCGAAAYSAAIVEIRPFKDGKSAVLLDKTIFYPEGGGQSSDRGTVNGIPLLDVEEKDGEILHIFSAAGAACLSPGSAELLLDVRRRRDFTVHHTAQHLLSGTILRLAGKPTASMHLGDAYCTIDVDSPGLDEETLGEAEEAAADAIEEDHPVIIHLCPPEDVHSFPLRKVPPAGEDIIRVVEIEGNDFSPCCGTHCRSTAGIGILRVIGAEKYKGMTRVTFIAGRRCLDESRMLRQNAGIVSRNLKVPLAETSKGVLALLEKYAALERDYNSLAEADARAKADTLIAGAKSACVTEIYRDAGIDEVLRIGRAAQEKTDAVLILASGRDLKFAAFCRAKGKDIRNPIREAMEKHGGRGGGGGGFFQGLFGSADALGAFLEDVNGVSW
jgi:alanyl-tRNA synthetase